MRVCRCGARRPLPSCGPHQQPRAPPVPKCNPHTSQPLMRSCAGRDGTRQAVLSAAGHWPPPVPSHSASRSPSGRLVSSHNSPRPRFPQGANGRGMSSSDAGALTPDPTAPLWDTVQGSPCPPSGFCGVPECGEWSEGSGSRGVPCQAPANFSEPPLVTYESTGVALGPSPTAGPAEAPEDTPSPEPAPPTASADVAGDDSGMDYSDTILGPIAIDPGNDSDEGGSALSPPIGTPGVSYGPPPSAAPDMQATPPRRTEGDSGGLARGSAAQVAAAGVLRAVLTAAAVGAAVRW